MKNIDRLKSIIFYHSLSKEDYKKISPDMKQGSLDMIIILSGMASISMVGLFFYSFLFLGWAKFRLIYVCFFFVFLFLYFASKLNKKWKVFSPNFTIYGFMLGFYLFTAIDSIALSPNIISLEPIVFLFLLSAFFSFNMIETFCIIGIMTASSCIISYVYSVESVKYLNISNFIIYALINVLLSYLINKTYALGYVNAFKAREAGYLDFMTGLHNRNYFKIVMPIMLKKVKTTLVCYYIDANDLHNINNQFGHEEGDKMLKIIADLLLETFGEYTFRIGGDEFLAFSLDPDLDETVTSRFFKEKVGEKGYHVSVGYQSKIKPVEEDMKELIRLAEEKMYQDKKIFYESQGIDRRSRKKNP